jgi:hypothetical protein
MDVCLSESLVHHECAALLCSTAELPTQSLQKVFKPILLAISTLHLHPVRPTHLGGAHANSVVCIFAIVKSQVLRECTAAEGFRTAMRLLYLVLVLRTRIGWVRTCTGSVMKPQRCTALMTMVVMDYSFSFLVNVSMQLWIHRACE